MSAPNQIGAFKSNDAVEVTVIRSVVAEAFHYLNPCGGWVGGWMGGWVGGWVGGWTVPWENSATSWPHLAS